MTPLLDLFWQPVYCLTSLIRSGDGLAAHSYARNASVQVSLNAHAATSLNFNIGWDITQNLDASHVDLCRFDYRFLIAWLSGHGAHYRHYLDSNHHFPKRLSPSFHFVSWRCVEAIHILIRHRACFNTLVHFID